MQIDKPASAPPTLLPDARPPASAGAPHGTSPGRPVAAPNPPSESVVKAAIDAANRAMKATGAQVQFAVDSESGRTLIRIVDMESRKVLRQIPSEEMLHIARNIDRMKGLFVTSVA